MRSKEGSWTKIISLLIAFTFVFPCLTWAFEKAAYPLPGGEIAFRGRTLSIPPKLGTVIQSCQGQSGRTVVYLQDLHCNYEVQKNIAGIIDSLAGRHDLKLVAVEGAWLPINVTKLSTFPKERIKWQVADYLMRQGRITGPEVYAATGRHPIRLEGVETADLYNRNYAVAMSFLNEETQGSLYDLRQGFNRIKPALYTPELISLDQKKQAFRQGTLALLKYGVYLYGEGLRRGLNVKTYSNLTAYMTKQADWLPANVDSDGLFKELEALDRVLRAGLYTNAEQQDLDLLLHRLDVMEKLFNISASTEDLAEVRGSPEGFQVRNFTEYLAEHDPQGETALDGEVLSLDRVLEKAREFYQIADLRSRSFVNNLKQRMEEHKVNLAVLVTGGFHTEQTLAEFKRQGVAVVCVKPRLMHQDVINPYFDLLRGRKTALDKLLAKNQVTLARLPEFTQTPDPGRPITWELLNAQAGPHCVVEQNLFLLLETLLSSLLAVEDRDQILQEMRKVTVRLNGKEISIPDNLAELLQQSAGTKYKFERIKLGETGGRLYNGDTLILSETNSPFSLVIRSHAEDHLGNTAPLVLDSDLGRQMVVAGNKEVGDYVKSLDGPGVPLSFASVRDWVAAGRMAAAQSIAATPMAALPGAVVIQVSFALAVSPAVAVFIGIGAALAIMALAAGILMIKPEAQKTFGALLFLAGLSGSGLILGSMNPLGVLVNGLAGLNPQWVGLVVVLLTMAHAVFWRTMNIGGRHEAGDDLRYRGLPDWANRLLRPLVGPARQIGNLLNGEAIQNGSYRWPRFPRSSGLIGFLLLNFGLAGALAGILLLAPMSLVMGGSFLFLFEGSILTVLSTFNRIGYLKIFRIGISVSLAAGLIFLGLSQLNPCLVIFVFLAILFGLFLNLFGASVAEDVDVHRLIQRQGTFPIYEPIPDWERIKDLGLDIWNVRKRFAPLWTEWNDFLPVRTIPEMVRRLALWVASALLFSPVLMFIGLPQFISIGAIVVFAFLGVLSALFARTEKLSGIFYYVALLNGLVFIVKGLLIYYRIIPVILPTVFTTALMYALITVNGGILVAAAYIILKDETMRIRFLLACVHLRRLGPRGYAALRTHLIGALRAFPRRPPPGDGDIPPGAIGKRGHVEKVLDNGMALLVSNGSLDPAIPSLVEVPLSEEKVSPAEMITLLRDLLPPSKKELRPALAALVDHIVTNLPHTHPKIMTFSKLVADVEGYSSYPDKLISLHADLAHHFNALIRGLAYFHEALEYFSNSEGPNPEKLEFNFSFETNEIRITLGGREDNALKVMLADPEAIAIAMQGIVPTDEERNYKQHYLIRALQRELYAEADQQLTALIKEIQRIDALRSVLEKLGIKIPEEGYRALVNVKGPLSETTVFKMLNVYRLEASWFGLIAKAVNEIKAKDKEWADQIRKLVRALRQRSEMGEAEPDNVHFDTLRREISEAIKWAPANRPAVILGAGRLRDIPDELFTSKKFKEIILVDIDGDLMRRAIAERGLQEQVIRGHIHVIETDLSMINPEFIAEIQTKVLTEGNFDQAKSRLEEILRTWKKPYTLMNIPESLELQEAGLVVSSTLLPGMAALVQATIERMMARRFPGEATGPSFNQLESDRLIFPMLKSIRDTHAQLLSDLVSDDGVVYLSAFLASIDLKKLDQPVAKVIRAFREYSRSLDLLMLLEDKNQATEIVERLYLDNQESSKAPLRWTMPGPVLNTANSIWTRGMWVRDSNASILKGLPNASSAQLVQSMLMVPARPLNRLGALQSKIEEKISLDPVEIYRALLVGGLNREEVERTAELQGGKLAPFERVRSDEILAVRYGFTLTDQEINDIFGALDVKAGQRILEIGPGHSVLGLIAALMGAKVTAVEPSVKYSTRLNAMKTQLADMITAAGGEFNIIEQDVLQTPLDDNSFDQVWMLGVLHDPEMVELVGKLRPTFTPAREVGVWDPKQALQIARTVARVKTEYGGRVFFSRIQDHGKTPAQNIVSEELGNQGIAIEGWKWVATPYESWAAARSSDHGIVYAIAEGPPDNPIGAFPAAPLIRPEGNNVPVLKTPRIFQSMPWLLQIQIYLARIGFNRLGNPLAAQAVDRDAMNKSLNANPDVVKLLQAWYELIPAQVLKDGPYLMKQVRLEAAPVPSAGRPSRWLNRLFGELRGTLGSFHDDNFTEAGEFQLKPDEHNFTHLQIPLELAYVLAQRRPGPRADEFARQQYQAGLDLLAPMLSNFGIAAHHFITSRINNYAVQSMQPDKLTLAENDESEWRKSVPLAEYYGNLEGDITVSLWELAWTYLVLREQAGHNLSDARRTLERMKADFIGEDGIPEAALMYLLLDMLPQDLQHEADANPELRVLQDLATHAGRFGIGTNAKGVEESGVMFNMLYLTSDHAQTLKALEEAMPNKKVTSVWVQGMGEDNLLTKFMQDQIRRDLLDSANSRITPELRKQMRALNMALSVVNGAPANTTRNRVPPGEARWDQILAGTLAALARVVPAREIGVDWSEVAADNKAGVNNIGLVLGINRMPGDGPDQTLAKPAVANLKAPRSAELSDIQRQAQDPKARQLLPAGRVKIFVTHEPLPGGIEDKGGLSLMGAKLILVVLDAAARALHRVGWDAVSPSSLSVTAGVFRNLVDRFRQVRHWLEIWMARRNPVWYVQRLAIANLPPEMQILMRSAPLGRKLQRALQDPNFNLPFDIYYRRLIKKIQNKETITGREELILAKWAMNAALHIQEVLNDEEESAIETKSLLLFFTLINALAAIPTVRAAEVNKESIAKVLRETGLQPLILSLTKVFGIPSALLMIKGNRAVLARLVMAMEKPVIAGKQELGPAFKVLKEILNLFTIKALRTFAASA